MCVAKIKTTVAGLDLDYIHNVCALFSFPAFACILAVLYAWMYMNCYT